jgi:hypothetical protein
MIERAAIPKPAAGLISVSGDPPIRDLFETNKKKCRGEKFIQ